MVAMGRSMLDAARGLAATGQGVGVSLDDVRARAQQFQELGELAAEDAGARAKDLTAAMKAAMGVPSSSTGSASATQPGSSGGHSRPGGPPGVSGKSVAALPGRKVLTKGTGATWMFVDSWYCIGPFPNPVRRNLDAKFPPETVVDLDAAYPGKEGRTVRWEHMVETRMPCVPLHPEPYAVYYAYTELYFDRARDLWIAVGSDDKSKVWIEGHLVWESGSQLKGWRVNEAYRKIHFRQGVNRVLLRLENGHGGTAFSLVVCTRPEADE